MSNYFDPYHEWLGIQPSERPIQYGSSDNLAPNPKRPDLGYCFS